MLLGVASACASPSEAPDSFGFDAAPIAEESAPLGGEALAVRTSELQRALRDMTHFDATLDSLQWRRDRSGVILFGQFLDAYMGTHLDPLLAHAWQSRHPELAGLDASLRLAKADVLIQLRQTRRVQQVIDDVATRYAGRENLLVEYPLGDQTTLAEALASLRNRKWRG
jgi:hypothetical protein